MEANELDLLADAISDVGYWQRWTAHLPDSVQLEFGGVQLAVIETGMPVPRPIHPLILRFIRPSCVVFTGTANDWIPGGLSGVGVGEPERSDQDSPVHQRPVAVADLPPDWPRLLQDGTIGPLQIQSDMFTFDEPDIASTILEEAEITHTVIGTVPRVDAWVIAPARLAFSAGPAGVVIAAEAVEVIAGVRPLRGSDFDPMRHAWFDYWKQYWRRRGKKDAFPQDWACEVTIPMKGALD
jgi:hypothetical protein